MVDTQGDEVVCICTRDEVNAAVVPKATSMNVRAEVRSPLPLKAHATLVVATGRRGSKIRHGRSRGGGKSPWRCKEML